MSNIDLKTCEIENMRIESTQLGYGDYHFLTFWMHLQGGSCGQGFGGYGLDSYNREKDAREPHPFAGACIEQILTVVGVEYWEDLPGKYLRVIRKGSSDAIIGIQNILDDKLTFFPAEFFKQHFAEQVTTD